MNEPHDPTLSDPESPPQDSRATYIKEPLLVPARMVNEWVYCPRLAYLMWVEGEWANSGDTAEGRRAHTLVDERGGKLPDHDEKKKDLKRSYSITLSSERLGVIAKMDVIESDGKKAEPIDYKKGKRPHIPKKAYAPERVQICVQGMILEDNGYQVDQGSLWYVGSRERVPVILDEDLRNQTLKAISELKAAALSRKRPPPLKDSPKCVRCSLAGICLPDETNLFNKINYPVRPLNPSDDPAMPLHIREPGSVLRKKGYQFIVEANDQKIEIPMIRVSQVSLFGPISVTTPAMHALMRRDIPVSWFSTGGWFIGHTMTGNGNVAVREAQYRKSFDPQQSLLFARNLVAAKVYNARTLLRRNWRPEQGAENKKRVLLQLKQIGKKASKISDYQKLLGVEGEAAALYFAHFDYMLSNSEIGEIASFSFSTRNRRPPTDPVNALLSFAYALLTRTFTSAITVAGLDPYRGLYHRPRHGRPSLALDLMEPFRPIVAESCVIQAINNGEVKPKDFVFNGHACAMKKNARTSLLKVFERRMEQETTHPIFGYRVSMRRLIEVQVRLFARYLQEDIPAYPHYLPR